MAIQQSPNTELRELALFAGAGGGILGGKLLGWRTVCAVEWDPYAASVLAARQNDGILSPFPIWDDVRTFDGFPWRGRVDVVSGGFPCQDISAAGKGAGISGERSSMWKQMARVISEVRPQFAFMENSPMLTTRGLGVVLGDLAEIGYDARWLCLSAAELGANHERNRIWIVASNADMRSEPRLPVDDEMAQLSQLRGSHAPHADMSQRKGGRIPSGTQQEHPHIGRSSWWKDSSGIHRVDDGVAYRMDRLRAIGNGQVPIVAATAFKLLTEQ